jgi:uncharacterized membrane protein YphA (DoxX/SURF4 family)/thiol-disulfide isomerase/thioredoxin
VAVVLIGSRLLLAAVFAVAGISKLLDRGGFRESLREFGVPGRLIGPVGVVLPVVEVTVAVGLLLPGTGWWAAVAAVVMLAGFTAVVGWGLARGRAPDCNCCGRLSRGPVGRGTLVRNGILAAVGVPVIVAGPARAAPGALGWITDVGPWQRVGLAAGVLVLVLLAFEGWLLVNLSRQNGRLLDRVSALEAALHRPAGHGPDLLPLVPSLPGGNGRDRHEPALRVGDRAPALRLSDLDGTEVDLSARWSGLTAVLFWSPGCGFCRQMLPELRAWEADRPADAPALLVISAGSAADNRAMSLTSPVLLDDTFAAGDAFGANGTPQAVLVDADGVIASPLAAGAAAVRGLLDTRLSDPNSGTSSVRERH